MLDRLSVNNHHVVLHVHDETSNDQSAFFIYNDNALTNRLTREIVHNLNRGDRLTIQYTLTNNPDDWLRISRFRRPHNAIRLRGITFAANTPTL